MHSKGNKQPRVALEGENEENPKQVCLEKILTIPPDFYQNTQASNLPPVNVSSSIRTFHVNDQPYPSPEYRSYVVPNDIPPKEIEHLIPEPKMLQEQTTGFFEGEFGSSDIPSIIPDCFPAFEDFANEF